VQCSNPKTAPKRQCPLPAGSRVPLSLPQSHPRPRHRQFPSPCSAPLQQQLDPESSQAHGDLLRQSYWFQSQRPEPHLRMHCLPVYCSLPLGIRWHVRASSVPVALLHLHMPCPLPPAPSACVPHLRSCSPCCGRRRDGCSRRIRMTRQTEYVLAGKTTQRSHFRGQEHSTHLEWV
jgi:hypothetical protein